MMRMICVLAAGLALSGCAGAGGSGGEPGASSDAAPPPANYREIVAAEVKKTFFDPYSIRDAEISAPKRGDGPSLNKDNGFYTPWIVCIRANAKNRMGGYTGRKVTAIAMSGDRVVNNWDDAQHSAWACRDAVYQPYPEIEEGYRPPAAAPAGRPKRG